MIKKELTSSLLSRAEMLLAIGSPNDALALYQTTGVTVRESTRCKALHLRLLASAGQWQRGMLEVGKVKPAHSLRLRQAGGRFLLSSMQHHLRQGDVSKAQECCTLARGLWPEGQVDHLTWGLKPPAADDYQAAETHYQIERGAAKTVLSRRLSSKSGLQSIQISFLKFRLATETPNRQSQLRIAGGTLVNRCRAAGKPMQQASTKILTWGRLIHARLRPLLSEVIETGLASSPPARMSSRGF